jgi:hypothetical protein
MGSGEQAMSSDQEFLQWIHDRIANVYGENENVDFLHRLRKVIEALAQRADEPVAWVDPLWLTSGGSPEDMFMEKAPHPSCEWVPLYTAAPAAPAYVPLSDEQITDIADSAESNPDNSGWGPKFDYLAFARAIEAIVVARMRGEGK